jgi:ATP-dependent RNA helicase DDX10/DBP4
LVIGGKSFEEEKTRIARMNILVCTPGRLLQHLDQTPDFHPGSLQLLGITTTALSSASNTGVLPIPLASVMLIKLMILLPLPVPRAVLDEADRILDMGFEKTVNSIVESLPRTRQTLLFSATQTRSVKVRAHSKHLLCLRCATYIVWQLAGLHA